MYTYVKINKDSPEVLKGLQSFDIQNNNISHSVNTCCIEISFISTRVLLDFLGLGVQKNVLVENYAYFKDDDIKVIDLGGQFVNLKDMQSNEKKILKEMYLTANKATAHLTHGNIFGGDYTLFESKANIDFICHLLNKHLYEKLGLPFPKLFD